MACKTSLSSASCWKGKNSSDIVSTPVLRARNPAEEKIVDVGENVIRSRPVTRGAKGGLRPPRKSFALPGKMCWTSFKTIGHS